jgi:hypothetical protein
LLWISSYSGSACVAQAFQADPQDRGGACGARVRRCRHRPGAEGHGVQRDRPQRHRIGGAEQAGVARHCLGVHLEPRRQPVRGGQVGGAVEARDRHRRDRRQVVRVQDADQGIGQLGEVIVQLGADAGVEIGEGLDQPRHERIVRRLAAQPQPAGDRRVRGGELAGQTADIGQLALIMGEKLFSHGRASSPKSCG